MTIPFTNTVVGLDLSLTATGVAVGHNIYATFCTPATGPERLARIRDTVLFEVDVDPNALVVIEGPAFGRANGMHALGQLAGVIYVALHERGITPLIVPPSTLKKYATGNGNAPKAEVLAAAIRRLDYPGHDDNQADALWLRQIGLALLDDPTTVVVPAAHRAALAKLELPPTHVPTEATTP